MCPPQQPPNSSSSPATCKHSCCCLQAPICNRFMIRQYPTMRWGLPAHFLAANNSALADFTDQKHRNSEGILKWLSELNKS